MNINNLHLCCYFGNVEEGRIIFTSIDSYEQTLEYLSASEVEDFDDSVYEDWENSIGFDNSMRKDYSEGGEELQIPTLLATVINKDAEIIIDKYAFKLIFCDSVVKVLDLEADPTIDFDRSDVQILSFDEDILASIGLASRCSENGVKGQSQFIIKNVNGIYGFTLETEIRYAKYGLYFDLYAIARTINLGQFFFGPKTKIVVEPVRYKKKCGSEVGPYNNFKEVTNGRALWQSYQGSTPLSKIHLRARAQLFNGTTNAFIDQNNWIQIKVNY